MGASAFGFGNLNAASIIECKIGRSRWQYLIAGGKAGIVFIPDSRVKAAVRTV